MGIGYCSSRPRTRAARLPKASEASEALNTGTTKVYSGVGVDTPRGTMPRMATGDVLLLFISCPEPECAQRPPQSCQFSRAQLIRSLNSGAAIGVWPALQTFVDSNDS